MPEQTMINQLSYFTQSVLMASVAVGTINLALNGFPVAAVSAYLGSLLLEETLKFFESTRSIQKGSPGEFSYPLSMICLLAAGALCLTPFASAPIVSYLLYAAAAQLVAHNSFYLLHSTLEFAGSLLGACCRVIGAAGRGYSDAPVIDVTTAPVPPK